MTIVGSATIPLAQLVDLLPSWGWNALLAGGLLAPLVGLLVSLAAKTSARWKRTAVGMFYLVSLPLAGLVFLARTEAPRFLCSFLILLPVGIVLGLAVLVAPRGRVEEQRGFEVQPKTGDKRG
jgi:hypothetical protein